MQLERDLLLNRTVRSSICFQVKGRETQHCQWCPSIDNWNQFLCWAIGDLFRTYPMNGNAPDHVVSGTIRRLLYSILKFVDTDEYVLNSLFHVALSQNSNVSERAAYNVTNLESNKNPFTATFASFQFALTVSMRKSQVRRTVLLSDTLS